LSKTFIPSNKNNERPLHHHNPTLLKFLEGSSLPEPLFSISSTGKNHPLDYSKYGDFLNVGTPNYKYQITNLHNLKADIGYGIYPNSQAIKSDETFKDFFKKNDLFYEDPWDSLEQKDWQKSFYLWINANQDEGVKTFFIAYSLEQSGHILQAIKAYYATFIHFPKAACWSKDHSFVWYTGEVALQNINRLLLEYPEINFTLKDAKFKIINGNDTNLENDIVSIYPGTFIKKKSQNNLDRLNDLNSLEIINQRGKGEVKLLQYANGHWLMTVDNKPFYIQGITYSPTMVGLGPKNNIPFMHKWMFSDKNKNGLIDAPYDAWIDKNINGRQDKDEPAIGDFQLMKDMGINAIRLYVENEPITEYNPALINKPLLREMHQKYGIRVIVGDFLGAYTIGSGASWEEGTDYRDKKQRKAMKKAVRDKVLDLKDEPFVLMWLLGNENNLPENYTGHNATRTNATLYPQAYAEFVNEVSEMIHELDKDHPVSIGNAELDLIEYYKEYSPSIDILGINAYRGSLGFGTLWQDAKNIFDRPLLITEFGCDAYRRGVGEDEEAQRQYHQGNWKDILYNQAGGPFLGNSLGGVIFEFLDEWWKDSHHDPYDSQQPDSQFSAEFPDGFSHEEWFGIIGQGNGNDSPMQRKPREVYYYYKELYENNQIENEKK